MTTKINIDLIVNGTKVHTRETTVKSYTHALVAQTANGEFMITNGSTTGPEFLYDNEIRNWSKLIRGLVQPKWFVCKIINNTVTINL